MIMTHVRKLPLSMMLMLAACQTDTIAKPSETQAILVQPTAAARKELRLTVARMLNVPSVAVADDALLHDSLMIIEKARPRDNRGLPLGGRDFDKPEQFRLMKIDELCVLIRLRTGARETLRESQCAVMDK